MKVVIEEEALDDLDEIHEWIAADDPPAADSTVERIFDAIDRLGRFPLIGHKGRARDTFEWVVTEFLPRYRLQPRSHARRTGRHRHFPLFPGKSQTIEASLGRQRAVRRARRRSLRHPHRASTKLKGRVSATLPSHLASLPLPRIVAVVFGIRAAAVSRRRSNDCRSASC